MRWHQFVLAGHIGLGMTQAGFPVDLNSTLGTTGPRNVRVDTGTYGPPVEEYHYFYDQWPIGLAVSKTGRVFTCYTRGSYAYTLGEVTNRTAEAPYPSLALNTVPGGLYNGGDGTPVGSADSQHLISVQALYVTPDDTLWVLDTGRPTVELPDGTVTMPYAAPGGPKLVAVDLARNAVRRTYTLPADVHFPDSYMNDLRFDLRANATASGAGIAYVVDSSNEGRNGFIMIDLGTGESWRQLSLHPSTLAVYGDVPSYQGLPFYLREPGSPLGYQNEGLDGAELSQYGDVMYYSPLTSDYIYSIETKYLRVNPANDTLAAKRAGDNVKTLGQRGGNANGFAGDSLGNVYMLMPEENGIFIYNDTLGLALPYVRDPRIIWPDSANVGWDGYICESITNRSNSSRGWLSGQYGRKMLPSWALRIRAPVLTRFS
ncbi:major royal jelly protein-domain-containing protein [Xylariaceae sp. FL0804]|nr:major royal jelly protein-domain-containing protein [Xylariaceae sp. FL0804]